MFKILSIIVVFFVVLSAFSMALANPLGVHTVSPKTMIRPYYQYSSGIFYNVTNISVGSSPGAVACDYFDNTIYVANFDSHNVSVINAYTNKVIKSINVGTGPDGVIFDSVDNTIWVANEYSDNVTIINASTNLIIGSVSIYFPIGFTFDNTDNTMWAANSNNVTIFNATTHKEITIVNIGGTPVYDSVDNTIWFAGSRNLKIVDATTYKLVGIVNVTTGAKITIGYDSTDNTIWAPGSNDVVVFNATTHNEIISISIFTGTPDAASYDIADNTIWVANLNSNNVSVIDASTYKVITGIDVGLGPVLVAYDSADNSMWVGNSGSSYVTAIDLFKTYTAKFTESGLPMGTAWYVDITTETGQIISFSSNKTTLNIGVANGFYKYIITNTNGQKFTSSPCAGNFTVNGTSLSKFITFSLIPYNLKSIVVGNAPFKFVYDSKDNTIWVANEGSDNVSIINASTDKVMTSVYGGYSVWGLTYDNTDNTIWVANYGSDIVAVFNASTNKVITSVNVGKSPDAITYDSIDNTIWVANEGSNNISVINASTDQIIGTATASSPYGITYDSTNNTIWVISFNSNEAIAINASTYITIAYDGVGKSPDAITYDSIDNTIWVANEVSNNISVIDASTNKIIRSVSVGQDPWGVAYDSSDNTIWVANGLSNSIFGINATDYRVVTSVAIGNGPYGIAIDSSDNSIWVASEESNYVSALTLNQVYSVSFAESGLPSGTTWYVNLSNKQSFSSTNSTITAYLPNGTYTYTIGTTNKIYSSPSGHLSISGTSALEYATFATVLYNVSFSETGLPSGTTWYVNLSSGHSYFGNSSSILFMATNGTYKFNISDKDKFQYGPTPSSGSFTVNGTNVSESIYFSSTRYTVTFAESTLPVGTIWYINITGLQSFSTNSTSITISVANGTFSYSVATTNKTFKAYGNDFTVSGTSVSENVIFNRVTYIVTFTESGLPTGTTWYVNFSNGQTFVSSNSTISFTDPNGSYTYSVATADKRYSARSGVYYISGTSLSEIVTFDTVTYKVTFLESGLPAGSIWYVNITGFTSRSAFSGSSIAFNLTNGTYFYSASTLNKKYFNFSGTDKFNLSGGTPSTITIDFTPFVYAISFTESGLPSGTTWYVNLSNGISVSSLSASLTISLQNGSYNYSIETTNKTFSSPGGVINVNGKSQNVPIVFSLVKYVMAFTESGLPSGTTWYVNLSNGLSMFSATSTIVFSIQNGTYAYTTATVNKSYASVISHQTLLVTGSNVSKTIEFASVTYQVTFNETGLPNGTIWYVNLSGGIQSKAITSGSFTFKLINGTYTYVVSTVDKVFSALGGSFSISGQISSIPVIFNTVVYKQTFTESGLPQGTIWYLNITGQQSLSSSTSTITVSLSNGSYTYTIATPDKTYRSNGGSFSVLGSPSTHTIKFTKVLYSVSFTESGLPTGTTWYVNLTNGQSFLGKSPTISFQVTNGSYAYTIGTNERIYSTTGGAFKVNGAAVSESVTFTKVLYTVTFTESGLPSGITWYLNITGCSSLSSTTATITVSLTNGTFSYTIATVDKAYDAKAGALTVDGSSTSQVVTFNPVTFIVSFTDTGLPSSTTWYVNITGGPQSGPIKGTNFNFVLSNGTYKYTIASADKRYSATGGSVKVDGSSEIANVSFVAVEYKVTFTESGLSTGTYWNVTFNGVTKSTTGTEISFIVMNGSYTFNISNISGFSEKLNTSTINVAGHNVSENIQFLKNKEVASTTMLEALVGGTVGTVAIIGVAALVMRRRK